MKSQSKEERSKGVYQVWISFGVVLIAIILGIVALTKKVPQIELILYRMMVIQR